VALTSGPILLVDDIISAWLDPLRGMLVALSFPRVRRVILNASLGPSAEAEAAVLKRKTSSPWWEKVTGVTLKVIDLSLNSADDPWETGTKGLAMWDEKTWLFIPLSCEPDDTGIV
jgi:hypothetical protein